MSMKNVKCYHCGNKKTGIKVYPAYIENLNPGSITAKCNKCGFQILIFLGQQRIWEAK